MLTFNCIPGFIEFSEGSLYSIDTSVILNRLKEFFPLSCKTCFSLKSLSFLDFECFVVNNKCIAATNGFKLCSLTSVNTHMRSKSIVKIQQSSGVRDSTKLQSYKKDIFTRWLSSTFFVSDAQSISDSFVLRLFNL